MEKIALIGDTTCDLTSEAIKKYNIRMLPFRIIYKDREYLDKIEISPEEVYNRLGEEVPTSSMPSMQDMEDIYCKLEEEGYTHAIAVTLSTGLSGIYNGLKIVSENHPNITTFIYDSKSISLGEGVILEECGRLIEEGKSYAEIIKVIPSVKERMHIFFVVGTLEYLKKGGRIGKVSGTIAELLNIKPIIGIGEDGRYYTHDKVRGRKQSLNKLFDICKEYIGNKKCKLFVLHGHSLEDAKAFYEKVKELPNVTDVVFGGELSPVSGVHSGPGLVALGVMEEP